MNNYKFSSWEEVTGDFSYLERRIQSLLDGWGMVNPEMLDEVAPELRAQVLREYLEANRMSALALQGEALVLPAGPSPSAPPVSTAPPPPSSSPPKVTVSVVPNAGAAEPDVAPLAQVKSAPPSPPSARAKLQVAKDAPWLSSSLRDQVVSSNSKAEASTDVKRKASGISLTLRALTVYLAVVTGISILGLPLTALLLIARRRQWAGSGSLGYFVNLGCFLTVIVSAFAWAIWAGSAMMSLLAILLIAIPGLVGLVSIIAIKQAFVLPRPGATK